jgi:glycosyltransferase involved in cell wall biosynthesis
VVHAFWASVTGLVAIAAARRHRVPTVVHVAGGELVAMRDIGYGGALGRVAPRITRQVLTRATCVTVATDWMRDHVIAAGHRVDEVVPLGGDRRWFAPAPGRSQAEPGRLVHVASLNRVKDQTTLLRAVAAARADVPGIHLDLVGVDTLAGEVQHVADRLDLTDATTFHGFVPHHALAPILQRSQLHVMASRHEAGPLAAVEAALCGVPTAGTRVGHIADLSALRPPAAAAVAVGDHDALAAEIVALLTDADRRDALASAARTWAEQHDADHTAARFDAIYTRLAAS